MQRSIFVVILTFSLLATASAVANPLNLFIQQCLRYQPSLAELDLTQPVAKQAVQFEQLTLGFNNINDRLNYYRDLASNSQRESILMCQLHLADELQVILNDPKLEQLINHLSSARRPYSSLATKLVSIKQRQLDINTKAKLHNAQATIRRNLSNKQLKIVFNDEECALETAVSPSFSTKSSKTEPSPLSQKAIEVTLAKYLILQPKESCRKSAWLAYQSRAKNLNSTSLNIVKKIKQVSALDALDTQLLDIESLDDYLQQQTININVAPWNIGQKLKSLPHEKYTGTTSALSLLDKLFKQLQLLGIRIEPIHLNEQHVLSKQNVTTQTKTETETAKNAENPENEISTIGNRNYRVWHHQRLLGELYLTSANRTNSHIIRYPVIGHQYGQASISYSETISNRRHADKIIKVTAEAVAGLARGNKFYLNNKQGVSADNHQIGMLWLAEFLRQGHTQKLSKREQAANAYRQQLRIFRAKVILDFYLNDSNNHQKLALAFENSFNQQWQNAADFAFSFNGIANEGIDYYLPLWHQSLVRIIFEASKPSVTERQVFDIFVVNEENLTLTEQMTIILTEPNDPLSIIRRAFNVGHSQI
ncbi:hypothetical protein L2735_08860 [Shewanella olleyana]|uniref:hypothetical protein n=1 Tax=Shewanella olleyana TaxID=135626 RepID=UPI00200C9968|nr:hypothetical protein [Shewanella olleyana]MCL1066914.1 hypothetical protein [Shewanella olleyana]